MSDNLPVEKGETLPATVDFAAYAGEGYENQTRDDVAIPFFDVLQPTERKDDPRSEDPPRGKAGDIFNNVTRELAEELIFVPCITEHVFIAWAAKKDKDGRDLPPGPGGPQGQYHPTDPIVKLAKANAERDKIKFGTYFHPDDETIGLVETFNIYALILPAADSPEITGFGVISFTSTKIKAYRGMNTRLNSFRLVQNDGTSVRPALFSHQLRLRSKKEKNDEGVFYIYTVDPVAGDIKPSMVKQQAILDAGAELKEMVLKGLARPVFVDAEEPSFP
jgi:hypothetical protein